LSATSSGSPNTNRQAMAKWRPLVDASHDGRGSGMSSEGLSWWPDR
jgi:hypothetical protein